MHKQVIPAAGFICQRVFLIHYAFFVYVEGEIFPADHSRKVQLIQAVKIAQNVQHLKPLSHKFLAGFLEKLFKQT